MPGQDIRREEARMHTYALLTKVITKNWSKHRSSKKFKFFQFARVNYPKLGDNFSRKKSTGVFFVIRNSY